MGERAILVEQVALQIDKDQRGAVDVEFSRHVSPPESFLRAPALPPRGGGRPPGRQAQGRERGLGWSGAGDMPPEPVGSRRPEGEPDRARASPRPRPVPVPLIADQRVGQQPCETAEIGDDRLAPGRIGARLEHRDAQCIRAVPGSTCRNRHAPSSARSLTMSSESSRALTVSGRGSVMRESSDSSNLSRDDNSAIGTIPYSCRLDPGRRIPCRV